MPCKTHTVCLFEHTEHFALEQNAEERVELYSYRWVLWSLSQWKCSHYLGKSMKAYYCSNIKMHIRATLKIFQDVNWIFFLSFSTSLLVAIKQSFLISFFKHVENYPDTCLKFWIKKTKQLGMQKGKEEGFEITA